jgi:hypothetical protein
MKARKPVASRVNGEATAQERALTPLLRKVHRALFRHPIAVQAAFSSLVAEGKRYARTPEGAAWRAQLMGARETANAQLLWEILSTRSFTEQADGVLPSTLVDALSRAIRFRQVEPLLARILEGS